MKTTVEISDALADEIKQVVKNENTTLRALVEAGLREILRGCGKWASFRLRDARFQGNGLQPEFRDTDWQRIRDAAYESHGT